MAPRPSSDRVEFGVGRCVVPVSGTDTTTSERWARVAKFAPVFQWLPGYRRGRLRNDLVAGALVAALMIPQSLGYATIAGVPVEVGLYAVPLALLAYAVLGSSPQLIVGPASTVAIVSGSLVADISRDNPQDAVAITSALAVAAGLVLVVAGMLRISWLAEFLSKPIVTGFVLGLTLTIIIGELPTLLGIPEAVGGSDRGVRAHDPESRRDPDADGGGRGPCARRVVRRSTHHAARPVGPRDARAGGRGVRRVRPRGRGCGHDR